MSSTEFTGTEQAAQTPAQTELALEQAHADRVFAIIDADRKADAARLKEVMLDDDPDPQARVERETEYARLIRRIDRAQIAEMGLLFGRIDVDDTDPANPVDGHPGIDRRYIGRIGVSDEQDDYRTLSMDWRAPQARPFYLATTAHPEGVSQRRQLRTAGRTVTDFHDEWLSGVDIRDEDHGNVGSESALLDALNRARTGHMTDIVETIQREQDTIIRDDTLGVLVVEGGPGTGKTAVALHRVAWLLYTHRERLERSGILIIGPNSTFLDYISRVLPSLGETGVALSTIGNLYPGITATGQESNVTREVQESNVTREVKGSEEMVYILREAVRNYQIVPAESLPLHAASYDLTVTPSMVRAARTRARRSNRPHNSARPIFQEHLVSAIAEQLRERIGADPLGGANLLTGADMLELIDELNAETTVTDLVDELWPTLEPEAVLSEFLSNADAIAAAATEYDEVTQAALLRDADAPRAPSDAALLDELAELIGVTSPDELDEQALAERKLRIEEAQQALDILTGSASQDVDDDIVDSLGPEVLMAYDVIDAESLAERHTHREYLTTVERAMRDPRWAFGHIIVDEAQEISAMEWRMLFRRSPNRWLTLVGDIAQTSNPGGTESWDAALSPFVADRWRSHQLTVNYRTPQRIMDFAAQLLPNVAPEQTAPQSIRDNGRDVAVHVDPDIVTIAGAVAAAQVVKKQLAAQLADRSLAVIVPEALATAANAEQWAAAELPVYSVDRAKGLEFDEVIVVDPDAIAAAGTQGLQDLYVALTRATQGLAIITVDDDGILGSQ